MQKSDGGSRSLRMAAQWPALQGQKISQTVFTLEPCAMRPAHVHPRATGLLYVVSGGRSHWDWPGGCHAATGPHIVILYG